MVPNADRFASRAEAYEQYRARFPQSLLARLAERCGLSPASTIADIGAGTGMLAELFLRNGNPVTAVEPNDEMRAGCVRLEAQFAGLRVVAATAESTTLAARSTDFVVVGRAFHWFDRARALPEFRRILKPEGWLVIITSKWAGDGSDVAREFEDILKHRSIDYGKVLDSQLTREEAAGMFAADTWSMEELHAYEALTEEQLVGRAESLSVTPMPDHPLYAAYRRALDEYFERHASNGQIVTPVSYRLIYGQLSHMQSD